MQELIVSTPFDGALALTLNRPEKGNALDAALVERMHDAFDLALADRINVVILSGNGRHFCTGFDLSDIESSSDAQLLHRFVRIELLLQKISGAPMMTACAAHGRTVGAGADLLVACERRFVRNETTLAFPGAGFGIVLGTGRLASRVGRQLTRDLVRTGRQIDVAEALESGLVSDIFSEDFEASLVDYLIQSTGHIDLQTAAAVCALTADRDDQDLAALVRSAARPGLRERVLAFRYQKLRPSTPI
jgi:enoyl-CoA hydratase